MTLPDLDARLAARTYMARYPDEMQQMLVLRELDLNGASIAHTTVTTRNLEDHYMRPYPLLAASLEKAVAFNLTKGLIDPTSLTNITARCQTTIDENQRVAIGVNLDNAPPFSNPICMVAFPYD
ncbi:MAG: hypothetical protein J6386_01790 [Candidatus Synoicihabitans palmerolidicus]|nr:hypothetical protein [Candidatus Synoicihabitans palmerolidicus]